MANYEVETTVGNCIIHAPNRRSRPEFTLGNPRTRVLEREKILKLHGPTGLYYEGKDHSEAVGMLADFMAEQNVRGDQIILINVDAHSDITSTVFEPPNVYLGSWIRAAFDHHMFNREIGTHWFFRHFGNYSPVPLGVHAGSTLVSPDKILTHTFCIDHALEDPVINEYLVGLLELPDSGFSLVTSIDFDAGLLLGPAHPDYEIDLSQLVWLRSLCQKSAAVMTFHSPGFADPLYAQLQAETFRSMHSYGYPQG